MCLDDNKSTDINQPYPEPWTMARREDSDLQVRLSATIPLQIQIVTRDGHAVTDWLSESEYRLALGKFTGDHDQNLRICEFAFRASNQLDGMKASPFLDSPEGDGID